MMWLAEIIAALQGAVEAEKRVLATWGDKQGLRVVG